MAPVASSSSKDVTQKVVQANKDHQYALKVYTERLEAELEVVDKLLAIAEQSDDDCEVNAGGTISIPDSVKAGDPIYPDFLSEDSPFQVDSEKRKRYVESTMVHPMRAQELDALTEAVRAENYRAYALESQRRGQQPFGAQTELPDHYEGNMIGINWERVAAKVADTGSSRTRTARECEIRWLGAGHPRFNHTPWTQPEIARVRNLVGDASEGEVDWVEIAAKLGTNRTPIDCMRQAIIRRTHTWTPEGDKRLMDAVETYGTSNWILVARMVSEDVTSTQCQSRYSRTLDPTLSRTTWTETEDSLLRRAVEVYGNAWAEISTFFANRSSEQCRERWQEKLNPNISKVKWVDSEDQALLAVIEKVGEGRWKEASRLLNNGRTDNMCRSRYHVLMKRKQRECSATTSPVPITERATHVAVSTPGPEELQQFVAGPEEAAAGIGGSLSDETPQVVRPKPRPRRKRTTEEAEEGANIQDDAQKERSGGVTTAMADEPQLDQLAKPKPKPRLRKTTKVQIAPSEPASGITAAEDTTQSANQEELHQSSVEPASVAQEPPVKRGRKRVASTEGDGYQETPIKRRKTATRKPRGKPNEGTQAGNSSETLSMIMDVQCQGDAATRELQAHNEAVLESRHTKGKGKEIPRVVSPKTITTAEGSSTTDDVPTRDNISSQESRTKPLGDTNAEGELIPGSDIGLAQEITQSPTNGKGKAKSKSRAAQTVARRKSSRLIGKSQDGQGTEPRDQTRQRGSSKLAVDGGAVNVVQAQISSENKRQEARSDSSSVLSSLPGSPMEL